MPAGGYGAEGGGARPGEETRPEHHDPAGGFRNPWPTAYTGEKGGFLRWQRERRAGNLPPDPSPEALPRGESRIAQPRAGERELRITWVGHATFLIQLAGLNLLTDPQWSERASPVQFAGPVRFTPPGIPWSELPPIDGVVLSHDHYDHLDESTVIALRDRFGPDLRWFTPLGYGEWFGVRGVTALTELDWWEETTLDGPAGALRISALPCQHWSSRRLWDRGRRLWASWAMTSPDGTSVYFGGDSGYFPDYPQVGRRMGPFDAAMLPIGAYEPRWFMRRMHMNPEEAVRAYLDLGGEGTMLGMHWGTWRLTDEDPLEPPRRTREIWNRAGLPPEKLQLLRHGETRIREGERASAER